MAIDAEGTSTRVANGRGVAVSEADVVGVGDGGRGVAVGDAVPGMLVAAGANVGVAVAVGAVVGGTVVVGMGEGVPA